MLPAIGNTGNGCLGIRLLIVFRNRDTPHRCDLISSIVDSHCRASSQRFVQGRFALDASWPIEFIESQFDLHSCPRSDSLCSVPSQNWNCIIAETCSVSGKRIKRAKGPLRLIAGVRVLIRVCLSQYIARPPKARAQGLAKTSLETWLRNARFVAMVPMYLVRRNPHEVAVFGV